ncbi:MAG TPA: LysE family translocator [Gemmatales bacterium]|nr:LysE family translocator [Gemmatales bacterium]
MTGIHDYWAFLLASFLLWITPGPDTMYILARSIAQGRWAGVLSGLAIGSGTIVHTLFAAFGLSAVLAASAWAFTCIKIVGACYLIYLGLQALLKPIKRLESGHVETMSGWRIYRQGFLTNLLNPKVAVFFLAFLPQFVDPGAGMGALPFLILGASFVVGGTLYCIIIATFAAWASQAIRRNPTTIGWLVRVAGCVYIGLGLNLLWSKPQAA